MDRSRDAATNDSDDDDDVSVLLDTISRMGDAIAKEFRGANGSQRSAYTKLVSACVSQCFGVGLSGPRGRANVMAAALWGRVLESTRNPRVDFLPSAPWLSSEHLEAMRLEAEQVSAGAVGDGVDNYPVTTTAPPGGARGIEGNEPFFVWAEEALGVALRREVTLNYLNYTHAGHHCEAHLDQPHIFEYNCLVCLAHGAEAPNSPQSQLRLFVDNKWLCYRIPVGGALIFHSSSTIHGRTPIMEGETLRMLSIGLCARDNR